MRLLIPKTTKKTFAARSFSVKGAELWNNLQNSVKISSSVDDFRRKNSKRSFSLKLIWTIKTINL